MKKLDIPKKSIKENKISDFKTENNNIVYIVLQNLLPISKENSATTNPLKSKKISKTVFFFILSSCILSKYSGQKNVYTFISHIPKCNTFILFYCIIYIILT